MAAQPVPAGRPPDPSVRQLASQFGRAIAMAWDASSRLLVGVGVVTLLTGALPPAVAWMQRAVIDGLTGHAMTVTALTAWSIGFAAAGVLAISAPYAGSYVSSQLRRALGLQAQERLFRSVCSFPGLVRFESPQFMDAMQVAQSTSQTGLATLITGCTTAAQSLVTGSGMLVALWVINPVLCMLVTASAGPAIVAQLALSRRGADVEWRISPAVRRQMFYAQLQTDPFAAKELRLFGLGGFLRGRMIAELSSINRQQARQDRRTLWTESSLALISSAVAGSGLVWTIHEAWAGHMSVGDVSLYILAAVGVQGALSSVVTSISGGYQALLLFGRYLDVVTAPPDLPVAESPAPAPALRSGIEFEDVWFRYDEGQDWVLRGVSLVVRAGSSVALVGLNGAGKSTLVKLLCRFYDPDRGRILWDGVDIKTMRPEDLRERIGAVFQDYMAYALTAAENIGMGDLGRLGDHEAITQAAAHAGIDQKLAGLPSGYQTLLTRIYADSTEEAEAGVFLSGGQWQRIALARSLMRSDRDLLILDEPNSGLDADAEHAIHSRMQEIRRERTSLLISQRLAAARTADTIFVLTCGSVVESGSHAQLMAAGGEYSRLFTLQASGYAGTGPQAAGMIAPVPA